MKAKVLYRGITLFIAFVIVAFFTLLLMAAEPQAAGAEYPGPYPVPTYEYNPYPYPEPTQAPPQRQRLPWHFDNWVARFLEK